MDTAIMSAVKPCDEGAVTYQRLKQNNPQQFSL